MSYATFKIDVLVYRLVHIGGYYKGRDRGLLIVRGRKLVRRPVCRRSRAVARL